MVRSKQELPAGYELGEFTIVRTLGQGRFGFTYLAKGGSLGEKLVVKENLPFPFACRDMESMKVCEGAADGHALEWSVQNFLAEARALSRLDHPALVRVLRAFSANGTAYAVMPFIDGEGLVKYWDSHGAPSEVWLRGKLAP